MEHLTLQRTLKFTTDDLKENREGRVSKSQYDQYKPPKISLLVVAVVGGHALLIGGLLAVIALITGKFELWIVFAIVLAALLLPFVLLQNEGNIKPTLRGDVVAGKALKACGIVILTEKKARRVYYELYVDGVTLHISATEATAFVNENSYCVYYLPRSLKLLSAEPA